MRALHRHMLDVLSAAQSDRSRRADWVAYEQQVMFVAVNEERRVRRLPPVFIDDILRVERMAVGHVDYSTKFALYCAELAEGRSEIAP